MMYQVILRYRDDADSTYVLCTTYNISEAELHGAWEEFKGEDPDQDDEFIEFLPEWAWRNLGRFVGVVPTSAIPPVVLHA